MRRVLVTGFEPFDGIETNASWEAVRLLDGQTVAGYRVAARRLSCSFDRCVRELIDAIEETEPAAVLATGVNLTGTAIQVERIAINLDDARIADNDGTVPIDRTIAEIGPAAYFSELPVKAIVAAVADAQIRVVLSNSAGTYVCNHAFYGLMHYVATRQPRLPAGFIHVPPGLESPAVADALRIAIERTLSAGPAG